MRFKKPVVVCKMDLEKAYDYVNLGFFAVHAKIVQVWGEMVFLYSSLYFFGAFLGFGERLSHMLL